MKGGDLCPHKQNTLLLLLRHTKENVSLDGEADS